MDEERKKRLRAKARATKEEAPPWTVRIDRELRARFTIACHKGDLALFKTLEFLMEEFLADLEKKR